MSDSSNSIAVQLRKLEEDLLQPGIRRNPQAVASLLTDDFCEFGSSGRIFNRQEVIEALQTEPPDQISIVDFSATSLSAEIVLVTYRAIRRSQPGHDPRISLRSSLWIRREGRWQMLFHQGTLTGS